MSKNTFEDYLKEKNIKMTEEDKFYCLSMINTDIRLLGARKSNKSFLNGLVMDYLFWDKDKQLADLEAKLAESEKKAYSRGHSQRDIDDEIKLNALREDVANKEKRIIELKQQLAEKDRAIENWQTMYESVVQTCHNDKEEIERLNKQLETQQNTITNLVEDNRASQEWYKKQLEDKEKKIGEYKLYIESFKHSQDLDKKYISKLESDLAEKCRLLKTNETLLSGTKIIEKEINQDKISFAVEQLEQLKHDVWTDQQDDGWLDEQVDIYFLTETIDNQIKRLTHQHKDKGE